MNIKNRKKIKKAITEYISEDSTDFELIWVYHRIFHERFQIDKDLPVCHKCEKLNKD